MQKNCTQCGSKYEAKTHNSKYCSRLCSDRAYRASLSLKKPTHRCRHCNAGFRPKAADRVNYCSRECYFAYRQANPAESLLPFSTLYFNACKICHKKWTASRRKTVCSIDCAKEDARRDAIKTYKSQYITKQCTCKQCGIKFSTECGNHKRVFCSVICSKRHANKTKAKSGNAQRAKHYGVDRQYFNELRVLERDGWRCQLCGTATPKSLRGKHKPNSPEIDHIIPLSQGGGHVWSNVQCACRSCNGNKGNKALGQLLLFGEYKKPKRINRLGGGVQ